MSKPDRNWGTGTIILERRSGSGEELTSDQVMKILRSRAARRARNNPVVDAEWEEGERER